MKIEQRKVRELEWEPQANQTALLASPIHNLHKAGSGAGEKTYTKRSQNWAGSFSSLRSLGRPSLMPRGCIFFCLPIKLSCNPGLSEEMTWGCNTGASITSKFCCSETEPRKLQTAPDITNVLNLSELWFLYLQKHLGESVKHLTHNASTVWWRKYNSGMHALPFGKPWTLSSHHLSSLLRIWALLNRCLSADLL